MDRPSTFCKFLVQEKLGSSSSYTDVAEQRLPCSVHIVLPMLGQHVSDCDDFLQYRLFIALCKQVILVHDTYVVQCSQVTRWVPNKCVIRLWFFRNISNLIQEADHPIFVLEYERVHNLHPGLLGPELNKVGQVLETFCHQYEAT